MQLQTRTDTHKGCPKGHDSHPHTHVSIYTRTHTQTNFKLVELERVDSSTSGDGSTASELKGPASLAISCSQDLIVSGFTQTSFLPSPSSWFCTDIYFETNFNSPICTTCESVAYLINDQHCTFDNCSSANTIDN